MSGLIWAGIGKGIADAGATFGNSMMKGIEEERRMQQEALREERLIAREEEREQRKEARLEAAAKKDADIFAQAEANAPAIGDKRRFEKFKADVGQTEMSEEELRKVFDEQYNQRRVGGFEGADRYLERYSKQKEDTLNEIRRLGGSSAAIKEGRESYKAAVEAEARADKDALDRRREDRRDQQAQQTAEYQTGMVAAAMRRADAAVTAAERPRSGGADPNKPATTADLQRQINAARDDIALALGATKNEVNAAVASVQKRAAAGDAKAKQQLETIQPFLDELKDANERMRQFKRPASEGGAPDGKGSDNSNVKRGPGTIPEPKSPAELSKLDPGTRYKAPDGTIRIKS